jgi:hypothetical protein
MHALFRLKPLFVTVLALALLCSLFPLVGCGRLVALTREGPPEDYAIAVIRTTEQDYSTFIEYLDEDLEPLGSVEYPYAAVDNIQCRPEQSGDEVYLTSGGLMGLKDSGIAFSLGVNDGLIEEYHFGRVWLQYAAVSDGFLFGAHNLNGTSRIDRLDIKTRERKTLELEGQIVVGLAAAEGRLVALAFDTGDLESVGIRPYVTVYSDDLEQTERFDLSDYESLGWLHKLEGDRLYFSCSDEELASPNSASEEPLVEKTIHYYSFADNDVVLLTFNDYRTDSGAVPESGFSDQIEDVVEYGGYLLVLNYDQSNTFPERNFISFYNKDTGQYEGRHTLDEAAGNMALASDGSLLVLGASSLTRYRIDGDTLTEIDSVALDPDPHDGDIHYNYTGFFMRE